MWLALQVLGYTVGAIVALLLLYLLFMVIATIYTRATGQAPKGISIDAELPESCRVGDRIDIVVRVTNRLARERTLCSVDFDAKFFSGFDLEGASPVPTATSVSLGTAIHTMKQSIPPNGSIDVRFSCRANRADDFRGDCTVYVDSGSFRYISTPVAITISA